MDWACPKLPDSPIWDFNLDGVFSISDLGLLLKRIYFYPADFVIEVIASSDGLRQFFEITLDSCTSWLTAAVSAMFWYPAIIFGLLCASAKS